MKGLMHVESRGEERRVAEEREASRDGC